MSTSSSREAERSPPPARRRIERAGICGIGQMGAAAAVLFERAGFSVLLWARDRAKLDAVSPRLDELRRWMDEHCGPAPARGGGTELCADLSRVDGECDVILDCIAEDLDQKAELLRRLTGAKRRGAVLLSTTSGLSITEMGRRSGTEELLVGAHFWNPPHLMPVVEVIRGEKTPVEIFEEVVRLVESLGKIAVRVNRDVPGFIGNRLQHALWREALHLVQEGIATAGDVDRVARLTFGLRLPAVGPFENMDLVGLELVESIHRYLLPDLARDEEPQRALEERIEGGKLGMKSGEGFYDWKSRDARALIERRDLQIVRQLEFLRRQGAL